MGSSATLQVVACLWVAPDRVAEFEAYERQAMRIVARYGGVLERVIRSNKPSGADEPFEVHVLGFASREKFEAYRADPELEALAPARAAAIAKTLLLVGTDRPSYAV